MYPVDSLEFVQPLDAALGALLLQRVGGNTALSLRVEANDGGRNSPFQLFIKSDHTPFTLQPASTSLSPWISLGRAWELQLDPSSSYNSNQAGPGVGDAFVWNGTAGFVASGGFATRYFSCGGAEVLEADWPNYCGFTRWRIVHWPERGTEPRILYEHDSRQDD